MLLESVQQQELDLALKAFERADRQAKELERQWEKRIEAARYEAERAARRYYQVEPENRLVARSLESDWNARLAEVESLEAQYRQVRKKMPFTLSVEQRKKIVELANDIPKLWREPTTKNSQRKQLVRFLIEDVTLRAIEEPWSIEVVIRWKSGTVSRHRAQRLHPRPHTTSEKVIERIKDLMPEMTDYEIADRLNSEGYRSGYGRRFTTSGIAHIRNKRGLRKKGEEKEKRRETCS